MIKRIMSISLLVTLSMAFVSCTKSPATDDVNTPGGKAPEMGAFEYYDTSVAEVSGLCLTQDGNSLWTISDDTAEFGGIYSLSFQGESAQKLSFKHDLEGITMNPKTGDIYLAVEGEQAIVKVAAPGYDKAEYLVKDIDNGAQDPSGKGLEGITWYKDDIILVANQARPTVISFISLTSFDVVDQITIEGATFLSDICYDAVDDVIWISDSKVQQIYRVTPKGKVLTTYSTKGISGKAEGLCVDRAHSCLWVGCDVSNRLYKISMTF